MKIVVLDGHTLNPGDLSWEKLKRIGALTVNDRTQFNNEVIIEGIGDAEIIFTNKTPL
ncbi:MAG: D-2-hydroxyacid dehydrogenase, partial [Arenibacter sp.]|nr:D-2-hydroxyacid dehydrogenase [Arenibacter sp.]